MNRKKNFFAINTLAILNGKGAKIAYRIKPYNLASFRVSFYIVKEKEDGYIYYKASSKNYVDFYQDDIIRSLEEYGFKDISYYEEEKKAVRKRLIFR